MQGGGGGGGEGMCRGVGYATNILAFLLPVVDC